MSCASLYSILRLCYKRSMTRRTYSGWLLAMLSLVSSIFAAPGHSPEIGKGTWPDYVLKPQTNWSFTLPKGERFDASALCLRSNSQLLTLNDLHEGIYRVDFLANTNSADLTLLPDCFTAKQLEAWSADKLGVYDCEGLCEDERGRLYVCEEGNRWILRYDPVTKTIERLDIDWTPVEKYFHPTDRNASFEGVAVHGDRLYVANERQDGRIIVVDLNTLQVTDDFTVRPRYTRARDIGFHDLCWFDGSLFALLRQNHVIVRMNPETKAILAEYDYLDVERSGDAYDTANASASLMEGLAVDDKYFWLCTDNNGRAKRKNPTDTRPTLFRCLRPDTNQ